MFKKIEPDWSITIGIKDQKVISIDWLELLQNYKLHKKTLTDHLINYFEQAIKLLKNK